MDEGHGSDGGADVARAASGLVDLAAVDFDLDGVGAGEAAEEGDFHVGDDGCGTDDEAFDAHELVRVCPKCKRSQDERQYHLEGTSFDGGKESYRQGLVRAYSMPASQAASLCTPSP